MVSFLWGGASCPVLLWRSRRCGSRIRIIVRQLNGNCCRSRVNECNRDLSTTILPSLPPLVARAILWLMTLFPKPRGFWDYTLFALAMTGLLVFLFWLEANDRIGWADAALAFAGVVLFVFATILARRGEKANWIAGPTWCAYLLASLGAFALMFGAIYADAYILHRRDITSSRLRHDIVLALVLTAVTLWSSRRRLPPSRQLL